MDDLKKFVESYGNFKVSNLGNGLTRIHAHNDKFKLGAICTEDRIRGSIKTKDGTDLYTMRSDNISSDVVKSKLGDLCTMYSRAVNAFESVKDDLSKSDLEKEDDDKKVLLDDKSDEYMPGVNKVKPNQKVIVGMSGRIMSDDSSEKEISIDDIIVENPVTEIKEDSVTTAKDTGLKKPTEDKSEDTNIENNEGSDDVLDDLVDAIDDIDPDSNELDTEADEDNDDAAADDDNNMDDDTAGESDNDETDTDSADTNSDNKEPILTNDDDKDELITSINGISAQAVDLADSISKLVTKLDDSVPDKKLIVTGLSSSMYSVAAELKSFVDEFLIADQVDASINNDAVTESMSVPSKVDYMNIARGGINQAKLALQNNKDNEKIRDILNVLSDIDGEIVTQL